MRNKQDLFRKLPFEIVKEIMLRLPVGSIPICKRVCKAWLHLLSSHEFLNSYISKLGPLKAVMTEGSNSTWCRVFVSKEVKEFQLDPLIAYEYDEEYDSELEWGSSETESSETGSIRIPFPDRKATPPSSVFEFPPGLVLRIEDSVNGLLFLRDRSYERNNIYVCNPMTRELCRLEPPPSTIGTLERPPVIDCGFGASRITGQHKVVAFHRSEPFAMCTLSEHGPCGDVLKPSPAALATIWSLVYLLTGISIGLHAIWILIQMLFVVLMLKQNALAFCIYLLVT
ncbi:hypothetical protein OROMI_014427 [Orobanche minor]